MVDCTAYNKDTTLFTTSLIFFHLLAHPPDTRLIVLYIGFEWQGLLGKMQAIFAWKHTSGPRIRWFTKFKFKWFCNKIKHMLSTFTATYSLRSCLLSVLRLVSKSLNPPNLHSDNLNGSTESINPSLLIYFFDSLCCNQIPYRNMNPSFISYINIWPLSYPLSFLTEPRIY